MYSSCARAVSACTLLRASFSTANCSISPLWVGPRNPIASNTRSALISVPEPGTSIILPSFHSTLTILSFFTLPFSPTNSLVAIAQSRSHPSSCDDDVRILIGQYGHTSGLFSCSGGCGSNSNCVTDAAPCRFEVPTQSEPVSPPPMTTTCLPVARIWSGTLSPATTLFCCGRNLIAQYIPSRLRPGPGRSRGNSAPPVRAAASDSPRISLALTLRPTCPLVQDSTPSAPICS